MSISDLPHISDTDYADWQKAQYERSYADLLGSVDFDQHVTALMDTLPPPPPPAPAPVADVPEDVARRQDAQRYAPPADQGEAAFDATLSGLVQSLDTEGRPQPEAQQYDTTVPQSFRDFQRTQQQTVQGPPPMRFGMPQPPTNEPSARRILPNETDAALPPADPLNLPGVRSYAEAVGNSAKRLVTTPALLNLVEDLGDAVGPYGGQGDKVPRTFAPPEGQSRGTESLQTVGDLANVVPSGGMQAGNLGYFAAQDALKGSGGSEWITDRLTERGVSPEVAQLVGEDIAPMVAQLGFEALGHIATKHGPQIAAKVADVLAETPQRAGEGVRDLAGRVRAGVQAMSEGERGAGIVRGDPARLAQEAADTTGFSLDELRNYARRGMLSPESLEEAAGVSPQEAPSLVDFLSKTIEEPLPPGVTARFDPERNVIIVPPGKPVDPATYAHEQVHWDWHNRLSPDDQLAWRNMLDQRPALRDVLLDRYLSGSHPEGVATHEEILADIAHFLQKRRTIDGLPPEWEDMARRLIGDVPGAAEHASGTAAEVRSTAASPVREAQTPSSSSLGIVSGGTGTRRFYHGTLRTFDSPEPGKFDPHGLFGPAYYVTDDARVAGSYAEGGTPGIGRALKGAADDILSGERIKLIRGEMDDLRTDLADPTLSAYGREWANGRLAELRQELASMERAQPASQIRPVDVPENLNLFDADAPIGEKGLRRIVMGLGQRYGSDEAVNWLQNVRFQNRNPENLSGQGVYEILRDYLRATQGAHLRPDETSMPLVNEVLSAAGYDGVRYAGGQRVPLMDGTGNAIEHNAVAIFEKSLPKVTNALSGQPGGIIAGESQSLKDAARAAVQPFMARAAQTPGERAIDLAGGIAGGIAADQTTPDDASPQERIGRDVLGVLGGGLAAAHTRSLVGKAGRFAEGFSARSGIAAGETPPSAAKAIGKAVDRLAGQEIPKGAAPIAKTAEEEVARLRLDKFPEDVRPLIQDAAERMGFATGQRRGVISDQAAEDMADQLGRTTEQWLRSGKAGRAYNTEELRALANSITTQAARVRELGQEQARLAAGGESTDRVVAQLMIEGDKLAALTALREGARAEAGRAMRAFRQEARLGTDPNEAISRIFAKVGGADKAREMASQYATMVEQGADPIQMAHFWSRVENGGKVTWGDWLKALRYNSMLSGPRSMEVDLVGTGAEVPWRLARDTFASIGRAAATRSTAPLREVVPELAGVWNGAIKGGGAFLEALAHGITTEAAQRGDLPSDLISRLDNPAAKAAAWSLEWVTRLKGGINEFQHQTAYGMAYGRLAGRQATREGLRGRAWGVRVSELVADPTLMPGMAKQAMGEADRLVYANELGAQGRNLAEWRKKAGLLGHVAMPFYPTVYNITARGIDRSPIGLVGTAVDVARGKYGRGTGQLGRALSGEMLPDAEKGLRPLGERLGDNLMGSAIGAWFTAQAFNGNISASGPTNPQERDVLRAQGWQPYSVRIGDDWVSYANWGPAAITLSAAASIAEANTYKASKADATAVAADAMRRFGEVFTEQTYLQSVGALYKAIREPDRYGGQWINSFMTSLVPEGSLINTVGQMGDPANRQVTPGISPQSTADAFRSRIPGLRQQLPVKRTALGDVEPNPYSGAAGISPLRITEPPNPRTANVRRYLGSTSAAQDYQIAQAIKRVNDWQNRPREFERPTQQEIALAKRYEGRENPRYQQLIQQAAAQERRDALSRKTGRR